MKLILKINPFRRLAPLLSLALIPLLLGACELPSFGAPKGSTTQGQDDFKMFAWSSIAAIVVGLIVWGLIFFSVIRYRRKKDGSEIPHQFQDRRAIEIIYTIIPILIVLALFGFTYVTENAVDAVSKTPQINITVTAFQWGWKFDYYDARGEKITEIYGDHFSPPVAPMPVGESIKIKLVSLDVVHGFYVPDFDFSRYAQPGYTNYFDLNIVSPGIYDGRCTQYCGVYHTQMQFKIDAMMPSQFNAWVSSKERKAA